MDRGRRRHAMGPIVGIVLALIAAPGIVAAAPPDAAGATDPVKAIVTFAQRPGKAAERAVEQLQGKVRNHLDRIKGLSVELPRGQLKKLAQTPGVVSVELDHPLSLFQHSGQTGDLEYENAWGVEHIGTRPVHLSGNTGQGIKMAVIDTGLDYIHDDPDDIPYNVDPEFDSNYAGGYDFVNNDADPMDDNGHGTHVSGIIAAEKNGYLVVGVAPGVQLYALKILGPTGEGDYSGLIAALGWAVDHDIDVVNMSVGGHEVSAALQAAVADAYAHGVTMVAASGNVNPNNINELLYGCPVVYPAAYDQVIAVSFTNGSDKLTGYSCTGPQVDIAAPGDQIFSTVPMGSCMFCSQYGYLAASGTSMASPHVAGVAALILKAGIANGGDPATLADDVKAHLCASTTVANMSPSDPKYPNYYGCGILSASKALIDNPPPPPTDPTAPVATDDAATTAEDTFVDVDVLANDTDPNGDTLSVSAATDPAHGTTAVQPNGTVRYTPDANYNGSDTFDYTVSDGTGGTDTGTVTVTVTAVNDPPTPSNDTLATMRNTPATISVLADDIDVDGDTLSTTGVTSPAHGTASVNPDGSVTYDPANNYVGSDAFDYTVSDGHGGTAVGSVAVSVVLVNQPPVAVDDTPAAPEDATTAIDVAANDTDADGGPLTVVAVTAPSHGTATIAVDNTVSYTPAANYNGPDSFTYTISDSIGATDVGAVSVTVTPVNDPPTAMNDQAMTNEDTPKTISVVANDIDIDGDALVPIAVDAPAIGSAAIVGNAILYTPSPEISGSDQFGYTVSDGHGGTATATVYVSVVAVNDPPTAAPKSVTTNYTTAVSVQMTGTDQETCNLTFTIATPPAHGTLTSLANNICVSFFPPYSDGASIKYTPAAGFSGVDTFTYRTSDGTATSPPATVTVTVNPPIVLHIGDIDALKTVKSSTWQVKFTLKVDNISHVGVNGVTIAGAFSGGYVGTATCKTNSSGICSVNSPNMAKSVHSITWTVTGLTYPAGQYDPSANHDPDGDSNGTFMVVAGP